MANNEHINKVVKSTGETLIDLTNDTVTAGTLLKDVTAHDRSGARITGAVIVAPTDVTETSDTTPYIYKSSEHDAIYDELVGGSVAWNQLVQNGNFESTSRWAGRYSTVSVSNNICTVTPSSAGTLRGLIGSETTETVSQNHKLLLSVYILSPITTNVGLSLNGNKQKTISLTANVWKKCECVWTDNVDTPKRLYALIMDNLTTSQIIQYKNAFIIDLTQMFGSTIADYAYNLEQSTVGSGIAWLKSYGFFTKDYYAYNAGGLVSVNTSGKKVVSETTEITYPIQSTDLRGLYKLDSNNKIYTDGDIYSADGQITRKYRIVDLGTLNWQLTSGVFTPTTDIGAKVQSIQGTLANILCPKYVTIQQNQISGKDKVIFGLNWGTGVGIIDSFYASADAFKTAISGVYLIYELATPATETARPFASPQMVYRNGTEEYLDARDVPMPVGGNRKYIDIPEWMVNQYFDDVRAEVSNVSDIIEKLRRIDISNGSSSTVRTIYAPDDSNGIQTTVRNNRTEVQVACGQASNANGRVVFTDNRIWGGIGNPTSTSSNHFMFNDHCVGDSIGKLSSGAPLTGSEFDLNYSTVNLNSSVLNIDDTMSIVHETDGYSHNTITSPYMSICTDGISLYPKTLAQFSLLINHLPTGSGSELVISSGSVYQSSSSRDIKHDIQYIENTESYHDALMQIKPATYIYNNDISETTKLGMIAEDIADVMPIAALTGEGGKVENYDTRAIIAMLVMEVQRLNAEIERLRGDSNAD